MTSPRAPGPSESRLFFPTLAVSIALHPMAIQMFLPALPAIQAGFGVAPGVAQLALSVSIVASGVATLVYGPLSDRFGRRPVLRVGQLLFVFGSVVCGFASGIGVLIAGRALQAAGAVSGAVLARAIVRDAVPGERVPGVLAYLAVAMAVAPTFAPSIGGALIDGFGWRAIFAFSGVVGLGAFLFVSGVLHETHRPGRVAPRGFVRLLRSRRYLGYALQLSFASAGFFSFISAFPYLVIDVMGRSATTYGVWFIGLSSFFVGGSLLAARLPAPAAGDRMIFVGCGFLLAGAAALAVFAPGLGHPLALFGPGALFVFGLGLASPFSQAGVVTVHPDLAGSASGLATAIQMSVAGVFAQIVGSLQDGTATPMIVCAGVGALASPLALVWGRGGGEAAGAGFASR